MFAYLFLLASALLATPALVFAQTPACPQLFAGGQPPALLNPKLGQRTTLLCNDAYSVLASGVTRGTLWSAEHRDRGEPGRGARHAPRRAVPR